MTDPGERAAAWLEAGARAAALFAAVVGTLVLLGWLLGIRALMQVFPGLVAMAPNAAAGLLLVGSSLWLQTGTRAESRLRGSRVAAVAAGLLGLLTLAEYVSGTNLGIDEILFRDTAGLSRPFPGRMAEAAAICFVTLAPALVLTSLRRAPWLAQALALIVGLVALLGLTGYAYGVEGLYSIGLYKGMAVHAALALFVLALGILLVCGGSFSRLIVSDTAGGVVARLFLPIGLVLPLLLGWLRLVGQQAGLYGTEFGRALQAVSTSALMTAILWPIALRLMRVDEQRKRNEQALRESEERYRHIVETAAEGIWTYDEQLTTIFVNHQMAEMLAYSPDEMIGRPVLDFVSPDSMGAAEVNAGKRRSGVGGRVEYRLQKKDGSIVWASAAATPQTDASGRFVGSVALVTDITERKQAEDEVLRLNAELEQRVLERTAELEASNRELEAFSYSVSHDLRAPLRAIEGFSRVLAEDHAARLDAEGLRVLGVVTENTRRMGELIDDLLGFARIARQQIDPTVIDMTRLARLVVAECRQLEPGRDVTVTIDPLPVARGDQPMVRQALVNLVSNAFKFTRPRPDARIEIGGEEGPTETTYLVRDNGVGFDPRYADQLFKVFQRLHSSTEFEGTGIGLAIVARIARRHGGRAWADGIEGAGATFAFALPREGGTDDA